MYIIIDSFTNTSLPLQNTFTEVSADCTYVVLNEDRFLPVGFISMFDIISDHISPLPQSFHDVYMPHVKIPDYYTIVPYTNLRAHIYHLDKKHGNIWYRRTHSNICTDRVDRLDENGNIIRLDFYNRYGFIAFSDFYNENAETINRTYYSADNKPVLNYSYGTDTYCQIQNGHIIMTLAGKDELISYCMSLLHSTGKRLIPTTFRQISLLMQKNLLDKQTDIFLFQSENEYLQYLNSPALHMKTEHIILMDSASTRKYAEVVSEPTHMIRYASKKKHILPTHQHALTLTMSDQVECLAELAQSNPNITFHIAANTMVSPILQSYERYGNVKIYPCISPQKLRELLEISSFYLDINHYDEILDAIVSAAGIPILLMGFEDTLHNPNYMIPECIFSEGDYHSFAKTLYQLSHNAALYSNYLNHQSEENGKTQKILESLLSEGENHS